MYTCITMSSAESLLDIQKILCQHKISATVTTWYQEGIAVTKIILKDLAGSQLNNLPVFRSEKKRKNPSRMRRDARRRTAHAAKLAASLQNDPAAAAVVPVPVPLVPSTRGTDPTESRRTATPRRKLRPGSTASGEGGVAAGCEDGSEPQHPTA